MRPRKRGPLSAASTRPCGLRTLQQHSSREDHTFRRLRACRALSALCTRPRTRLDGPLLACVCVDAEIAGTQHVRPARKAHTHQHWARRAAHNAQRARSVFAVFDPDSLFVRCARSPVLWCYRIQTRVCLRLCTHNMMALWPHKQLSSESLCDRALL